MLQVESPAGISHSLVKLVPMPGEIDNLNPPSATDTTVSTTTTAPKDEGHDISNGVSSSVNDLAIPNHRFSIESDLTYAPKLNTTSLRLAQSRQSRSGLLQRARATRLAAVQQHCQDEFTFKPQMSSASLKIAEALGTTFMIRQEQHLEKQRKKLEQRHQIPYKGRLSPVSTLKTKKSTATLKDKENAESSQTAWGTPTSTPNLNENRPAADIANSNNRLGVGGSISLHLTTPLSPVRAGRGLPQASVQLQRLQEGPYTQSGANLVLKRQKALPKPKSFGMHKRSATHPVDGASSEPLESTSPQATNHQRSKTVTSPEPGSSPRNKTKSLVSRTVAQSGERLRLAKLTAERAMKWKKIFMIQGPYPVVRECLRSRDWVEKQYRAMPPHKVKRKQGSDDNDTDDSDNDDDDDDNNDTPDAGATPDSDDEDSPLGDSDDIYGMMSRMVRNNDPFFIWTCRRDTINFRFLRKETIVNHFAKNGAFTTKSGLCTHLRNLKWYEDLDADTFYPRSYKICIEEEKKTFLHDYRLTAACSILKWVVQRHSGELDVPMDDNEDIPDEEAAKSDLEDSSTNSPRSQSKVGNKPAQSKAKRKTNPILSVSLIRTASDIVENYLRDVNHEFLDSDVDLNDVMTDKQWDDFIRQYCQLIFDGGLIAESSNHSAMCESLLNRVRAVLPQLDMDGLRNIWIIKPGAKSRGRGIICMNRLEEILKLVGNPAIVKEGKWVVQKYIERPLLIYNTKFDIRQWFLVTDWNPLTIWWYQSSYLRFCTQPFSLDNLESAIHLSNFSVQKNFENAATRSAMLPDENMWTSEEFQQYLRGRGCGNVWQDCIYPGMKRAVIAALQCTQDVVEMRKNSFELYGADFMLTEDFQPWLLEINSSPAMGATTEITEQLCHDVIEDTMKVVLDRRHDKNCDTGRFELAFRQPQVTVPPYVGAQLSIEGTSLRNPSLRIHRQRSQPNIISPRQPDGPVVLRKTNASGNPSQTSPRRPSQPGKAETSQTEPDAEADPELLRATNLEEMTRKLAAVGIVDGAWGRSCSRCNSGIPGVKLEADKTAADCACRRDSVKTPVGDDCISRPNSSRQSPVAGGWSPELIPRSGTFVSNRQGNLVTLSGPDPIQGVHKVGRAAFIAGKTRPNVNRQRRETKIQIRGGEVRVPCGTYPFSVSNAYAR
ncbi:tubulin monoglycylase TTLL3-like isoform X2 [Acanthaster planci]|uniref:Tubulin monoglycylase TTLL3-like isoform X2 n=1 Tax=Acanthaster planci TaxID=133434 RepID=A0A8B7XJS7_ACAPL|nr:tubulin monoglycylase TTLL3-like isoform X2 [Acanthaster planci]